MFDSPGDQPSDMQIIFISSSIAYQVFLSGEQANTPADLSNRMQLLHNLTIANCYHDTSE
jgi:hypothetical protein